MSTDDTYNGWTNRETWAVALHINNDQGWQESVLEALRAENMDCTACNNDDECEEHWNRNYTRSATGAGAIIRENVESAFDWEFFQGIPVPRDLLLAREDIGSLWRVNWTELGAAFLGDLEGDA